MKNAPSKIVFFLKYSRLLFHLFLLFFIAVVLCSCGYTNPYAQMNSQDAYANTLHITIWQNQTNELGLESEYFRLFNAWFKKSGRINVIFDEAQADLKLTGEIFSIDLPGLFYDKFDDALEIKINLTVHFTLYDNRNKTILWQEKQFTMSEPFLIDPSGDLTEFNKKRALLRIGDKISELIYVRVHEIVKNMPEYFQNK
jgi:hypothetical protein